MKTAHKTHPKLLAIVMLFAFLFQPLALCLPTRAEAAAVKKFNGQDITTSGTADDRYAVAIGEDVNASGSGAVAMGSSTNASGCGSVAMGFGNIASGAGAFTAGGVGSGDTTNANTASGRNAVALGEGNGASGNDSFAAGMGNIASGNFSVALGKNASATQDGAIGIGYNAAATGTASVAMGHNATAAGANSFTFGGTVAAGATNGVAIGNGSSVTGSNSVALGANSVASEAYEVSVGSSSQTRKISNVTAVTLAENGTYAATTGQLYTETRMPDAGNYYGKVEKITAALGNVDKQVKLNADAIIGINATEAMNSTITKDKVDKYETYVTGTGLNASDKVISNVRPEVLENGGNNAATTGQVYEEQEARKSEDTALSNRIGTVAADKNYIKSENSVSDNLVILDTQAKTNADAIADINNGTTTVGNATNATNDGAGNNIVSTYTKKSEFSTHTGDTTAHITAAERTKWNDYETSFSTGTLTTTGDAEFGGNMSVTGTSTFTGFATFNAGASMGGQKITNVLAGEADTDAVNVGQMNTALAGKADSSTTYTKTEVDNAMATKANSTDVYTKTEANTKFADKATSLEGYGITDAYTKTQVDTALSGKANTAYVDTKATEAENNAKSYTDTQISTEVTNRNTAIANAVATKADASNVYTKTETDAATSVKINSGDNINIGSGIVLKQGSNIELTTNGNEITIKSVGAGDADAVHYQKEGSIKTNNIVLEGQNAGDKVTIKNVAAGDITSASSTDAVNGGQLYETNEQLKATNEQLKGTYTDATYADSKLTLTKVDGTKTELTIDTGAIAGGDKPEGAEDAKATGEGAVASGYNSVAEGAESVATGYNAAVSKKSSSGIAIGNGTTVGYSDGTTTGEDTAAVNSIGIGYNTTVTGSNSVAVGTGHIVTGNNSGAFGDPNIVTGSGSYAIGNNNIITADNTFVLGSDVQTAAKNAVVLGAGSTATRDNTVSVGAPWAERQITNVAAGTMGTDAANMNQLWGVEKESREIAAMSGALAGLHYLEPSGEGDDRVTGAVAYGGYRGENAAAVGLAYKPSPNVMVSASTSVGNSQNIYNAGVSVKFGKGKTVNRAEMAKQIKYLGEENNKLKEENAQMKETLKTVLERLEKLEKKPAAAKDGSKKVRGKRY